MTEAAIEVNLLRDLYVSMGATGRRLLGHARAGETIYALGVAGAIFMSLGGLNFCHYG